MLKHYVVLGVLKMPQGQDEDVIYTHQVKELGTHYKNLKKSTIVNDKPIEGQMLRGLHNT